MNYEELEKEYFSIILKKKDIMHRIGDLLMFRSDFVIADILDEVFWMNDFSPVGMLNLCKVLF